MGFTSYKGSIGLTAGLTPASDNKILMESCNIQVDENGSTLADRLNNEVWIEDETGTIESQMIAYAASVKSGGPAYVGQKLTYIGTDGSIWHFVIEDINGSLIPLTPQFSYNEAEGILDIQMRR